MRAGYINNLYGTYGNDPFNKDGALVAKIQKYSIQGLMMRGGAPHAEGPTANDCGYVLDTLKRSIWLYRDPTWDDPRPGPVTLARKQVSDLHLAGRIGKPCGIVGDIEFIKDPNYIIAWYLELRQILFSLDTLNRNICWTPEGKQGGWFSDDLVTIINSDPHFFIAPQQYGTDTNGKLFTLDTVDNIRNDIISRGVNPVQVKIIQDGSKLTPATFPDGIAYTVDEGSCALP